MDSVCDEIEVIGCQESEADNYNPLATDSGDCIYYGCTDNSAFNYDPIATDDDGSCIPVLLGCTDEAALNYDANANTEDNSCYYSPGCTNPTAFNFDVDADFDDGSCIIYGCTDDLACNYNNEATDDNGSCVLLDGICETCSEDGLSVVDNDSDDDGVCDADEIAGCQDATACNYNENATDSDDSCVFATGCETCSGETDGTGTVVDNDSDDDGVCDADEIAGCQDATACNYNDTTMLTCSCLYFDAIDVCGGDCAY